MPDIPHRISAPRERADDLIATTDSYHADLTINAPIDSAFAAVSSAEGLSGWWTTDTGGPPEPGGELRFTFSDGVAVMRVARTVDYHRAQTGAEPADDVPFLLVTP